MLACVVVGVCWCVVVFVGVGACWMDVCVRWRMLVCLGVLVCAGGSLC